MLWMMALADIPTTQCACSVLDSCAATTQQDRTLLSSQCASRCASWLSSAQAVGACWKDFDQKMSVLEQNRRRCAQKENAMCLTPSPFTEPTAVTAPSRPPPHGFDPMREMIKASPAFESYVRCVKICTKSNGLVQSPSPVKTGRRKRHGGDGHFDGRGPGEHERHGDGHRGYHGV